MRTQQNLKQIVAQLQQLQDFCKRAEVHNPAISTWSVGQHLEHLILAAMHVHGLLEQERTSATAGRERLTLIGRIVFLTGRIKRGVGKSPQHVTPAPQARDRGWLEERIRALSADYARQDQIVALVEKSTSVYRHPYFGELNLARWLRFMVIHQDHHLRILRDILR